MSTVLLVELQRALARRLLRLFLLLALLLIAAIVVGAFIRSNPDAANAFSPGDIYTTEENDSEIGFVGAMSLLFVPAGLLLGASFVGAEYRAGTITALLTWEPRRVRALGAKLVAAGLVAAGVFVALELVLATGLGAVAIVRGTTDGADAEFYRGMTGFVARCALLTGGLSVLGACIALLGRNTTAALGAVFGYIIVVESVLRGFRPGWNAWFFLENFFIVLGGEEADDVTRSVTGAGLLLVSYLAVLVAASMVTFARRDVT